MIRECPTCNRKLRSDNTTGFCTLHNWQRRVKCVDCGNPCQHRHTHCSSCAIARRRKPRVHCNMEGCDVLLSENTVTGFCRKHCFAAKKCAYEGCEKRMPSWNVTDFCPAHYSYSRKVNETPRPKNPWVWDTLKLKIRKIDKMALQNLAACPPDERRELPLSALPLRFHARTALEKLGCATLGSLESVDINELARREGVGRSSVIEIVSRMRAIKLVPRIRVKKATWSKKRRALFEKKRTAQASQEV